MAAWLSLSGGLKIGAQLTDDGSGLGEVGSDGKGGNAILASTSRTELRSKTLALQKRLLVLRDLPSLAVPPTSSGERSAQTLIPWVERGFMWQGWEKWGDPSWKPGVSQEKMPPWRGGWVSSDLHPLEEAASE